MSTTEVSTATSTEVRGTGTTVNMRPEVVMVPVSDVDLPRVAH